MDGIERMAFFTDKNGNEINTIYNYNPGKHLRIDTYCGDNPCGYLYIYFHPNKRLYLDVIYCYTKYRHAGIATYMMKLAEYVLKDYNGYVIRGAYEPGQLSTDRSNGVICPEEEMRQNAVDFYHHNGYEIINYIDYLNNSAKFPYINESDFILGEDFITSVIVAKKLEEQDYSFFEERKVIFHNSYSELILKRKNIK